ncbi:P-loop containing nucleoside triphosphate hydrolase protein [Infundibulicybe gibba]|nr:P-loop containing nucleoside triphosphate hydrolase protein [Infundibulicybe gibba]
MSKPQDVNVTIVGDGSCGKTCLCRVFATGTFEQMFIPTIYHDYSCDATSDGVPIRMSLRDTAGQEEYDRLRPLSYQGASVIRVYIPFWAWKY